MGKGESTGMYGWLRRLRVLVHRGRHESELAEEMATHRDMAQRDLESRGLTVAEAAIAARRRFGSTALAQDRSRDIWVPGWLQGLGQDVGLAVRTLRATPMVTMVALLSLALGIGANTAMFSLVNSLLLRALPVADPDRLVVISTARGTGQGFFAYPVWHDIQQRQQIFDQLGAWGTSRFNLSSGGETQLISGAWTSGGFFDTLGVQPAVGRAFGNDDDRRGGGPDGPVAVISFRFWQDRYGGAADAIGRRLLIESVPFTIVGVTPPSFFGVSVGADVDVFVPIGTELLMRGHDSMFEQTNRSGLGIIARLKPGQSRESAAAALRVIQPQIRAATLPATYPPAIAAHYMAEPFTLVPAATGVSFLRNQYQLPLLTLLAVVSLVLLIACANIANLLLARTTARRHELAVRRALGASRWRLARQLFVESALVAAAGAALGLVFASWGSRVVVRLISTPTNTVFLDLSPDARVLAFTIAVGMLTAILFGVAPAVRAAATAPVAALKDDDRSTTTERRGFAAALVVVQIALSVVLVVGAGLFVRTLMTLAARDLGFTREGVLLVTVNAVRAPIAPADRVAVFDRARDAIRTVPGVTSAAVSLITPVGNAGIVWQVLMPGGATPPSILAGGNAYANAISPGWFETMRTPVLAGRDFTDADVAGAPAVALVNESLARAFLQDGRVLGRAITLPFGPTPAAPVQIVGIVADAAYRSVREPAPRTIYLPLAQSALLMSGPSIVTLSIRSSSAAPALLAHSVSAAISRVNPALALTFRPLADQVDAALTQERLVATISSFFAVLALALAALGLYGVTAYAVSRRRREIGIRIALGAAAPGVIRLVLGRIAGQVSLGLVAGAGVSVWASRFVAALLYGLQPGDPNTLAGAVVVLTAVAVLAAWLPARRATRVDPAIALRYE